MNILLLAPQPFYQNRGTPIAVDLLVQSLCRAGHQVDLVVFNEGDDKHYENLTLIRVGMRLAFSNISPGFSLKKIVLDAAMLVKVIRLLRHQKYDVIHAVEESAFIAWLVTRFSKTPFIYDMDSSLATQLTDKLPSLNMFKGLFRWLEAIPIKKSLMVIPVCDALAVLSHQHRNAGVHLLKDVSLLDKTPSAHLPEPLQSQLTQFPELFNEPKRILLYVGNLESYQGIDLMLESHALAAAQHPDIALVVVGGSEKDIQFYREKANELGAGANTVFLGPKPIALLHALCQQSHLLLSPRIKGENTPMKLYSYLDSGVPVLATDLPTHTEVINPSIGYVAEPEPAPFASAICSIFEHYDQAKHKAAAACDFISIHHSKAAFERRVNDIYQDVAKVLPGS